MGIKWTSEHLEILEREYPKGGFRAVQKFLPERTQSTIRAKAAYLQLRVENHAPHVRQEATEFIDAAIKRAYLNGKPDLMKLAKSLNRTRAWIKWRAMNLGISKAASGAPTGPWLPEEDALLEDCLDREYSIATIQKKFKTAGYRRTLSAIVNRVRTRGLRFSRDWWNVSDVARAFNVDEHVPMKWVADGKLKAVKSRGPAMDHLPIECEERTSWKIKPVDLRKFMLAHPSIWDHRRMNKEILIDLLAGGADGLSVGPWGVASTH